MNNQTKPKLRNINVQQIVYQGEPAFVLHDSQRLTDAVIVLPQALGPLALLCDGKHTIPEIKAALEGRYSLPLPLDTIENLLDQFDQALLLDGQTYDQARQKAIDEFRVAPFRPSALAGGSYPADPDDLRHKLQRYLDQVDEIPASPATSRGLISPHIDYPRGGSVYAKVWASAAEAVREVELVIIVGTDHNGNLGTLTLTCQNYATPLGMLPTDKALVQRLADALGPDFAFADELHHRTEWSLELVMVWLQYMRGEKPCPVLPVLCGSFLHYMVGQANIKDEPRFKTFVELLREEMSQRRTLVVASGDLAHLGPQFDGPPLDETAQAQMEADDKCLLNALRQGNAGSFFEFMQAGQYQRNVCGLSPFYFMFDLLGETQGQSIAYARCPAEHDGRKFLPNGSSFVSVCGMVFE
jgi:AmmeMemoRadiSam system protein B